MKDRAADYGFDQPRLGAGIMATDGGSGQGGREDEEADSLKNLALN